MSVPQIQQVLQVLQEYLDKFFIGDNGRSAKLMIELLVHSDFVSEKAITAENVVQHYTRIMQACKCEYPIQKMGFEFKMCNDTMNIIQYLNNLTNLTQGSFLSVILGNLKQVKLFVNRNLKQSDLYGVDDFNTFRKKCHSETYIKLDYKSDNLFKVVRNPESAGKAFNRYSASKNDKEDAYYGTLTDIANFKRDISDFCESWRGDIQRLKEEQDKFEKFCEIYPAKSLEFAGELNRLKGALEDLEKEASKKNGAERISSGLNVEIVNLKAKIKGKEEKLQHNFNRYQDREITRSEIQSRADERVIFFNKLFEDAYNFSVSYME